MLPASQEVTEGQLAAAAAFAVAFYCHRDLATGDQEVVESRVRELFGGGFDVALDLVAQHGGAESALFRDRSGRRGQRVVVRDQDDFVAARNRRPGGDVGELAARDVGV